MRNNEKFIAEFDLENDKCSAHCLQIKRNNNLRQEGIDAVSLLKNCKNIRTKKQ